MTAKHFTLKNKYDLIVIPGYTHPFASRPPVGGLSSLALARLRAGYRAYQKGLAPKIVVSGGSVLKTSNYNEARELKRKLEAWGVPQSDIIVEDQAKNTVENYKNVDRILKENGWKSAFFATRSFQRFYVTHPWISGFHFRYRGLGSSLLKKIRRTAEKDGVVYEID